MKLAGGAALAVAVLLATGGDAPAQHRGMAGGAHWSGGMHGNWGGYHPGNWYGNRGWGGYGWGYPGFALGLGFGYPGYYGGYGGYGGGYYGGYGDYGYPSYSYSPTYVYPQVQGVQTQSAYEPAGNTARLVIQVPPDAQVTVEGQPVQQMGPVRQLVSPPLEPGKPFHYTVKAQWNQNGQPVTQEKKVDVQAGQTATVDFNQQGGGMAPMPNPPGDTSNYTPPTGNPPTGNNPPNPNPPAATPPANPNPPAATPPANPTPPAPTPPATPNPPV
jgi:uncharacterized protein (TIGR03000 family)